MTLEEAIRACIDLKNNDKEFHLEYPADRINGYWRAGIGNENLQYRICAEEMDIVHEGNTAIEAVSGLLLVIPAWNNANPQVECPDD